MNGKQFFGLLTVAVVAAMFSCVPRGGRVIENPAWQAANTRGFDVTRVTLTDTATIVNIDAYADPKLWIRWDTTTYLAGGGKKYMIKRADGIELTAEHFVPESGRDSFVFYFEPIDPRLKTIDLIEGDFDSYFKIWGIDLRGGKSLKRLAGQIPESVRAVDHSTAALPEPELKNGVSTLRVKVVGYNPDMGYDPDLSLNSAIPQPKETILPVEVVPGEWLFEVPLFGPTTARLTLSRMMDIMYVMLEPGADNTVWIDLAAWASKVAPEDEERQWAFFDGRYATFNTVYVNEFMPYGAGSPINEYRIGFNEPMLREMVGMPREELFPKMKAVRDELLAKAENSDLSPAGKEVLRYRIETDYIENIGQLGFQIAYQYAMDNGIEWGQEISEKMTPAFTVDDYRVAYEGVDAGDPYLFYGMWYGRAYDDLIHNAVAREASGVEGTVIGDILAAKRYLELASYAPTFDPNDPDVEKKKTAYEEFTAPVKARYAAIESPFVTEALALREEYVGRLKAAAAAAEGVRVNESPAGLDTFEGIVAKYKGSPVMVDLWATWCGPCLMAMKSQRAMKEKLMEQGVVFVYITGETSPKETWETMIPDIKGEHYYLTDAQWRELNRKFDVDGIPFYIMVQRDGTYKADTAMRSPNVWESTIRAALDKSK